MAHIPQLYSKAEPAADPDADHVDSIALESMIELDPFRSNFSQFPAHPKDGLRPFEFELPDGRGGLAKSFSKSGKGHSKGLFSEPRRMTMTVFSGEDCPANVKSLSVG